MGIGINVGFLNKYNKDFIFKTLNSMLKDLTNS